MDNETRRKVEKLPVWAKNLIKQLENSKKETQNELNVLLGNEKSRICYGWAYDERGKKPIPEDQGPIIFKLGDDDDTYNVIDVSFEQTLESEQKALRISCQTGILSINPQASNVVSVKIEKG